MMFCEKHQREKYLPGGESAHPANWYCADCEAEETSLTDSASDKLRWDFEKWISQPPYEHACDRYGEDSAWPGQYKRYDTQLAWEAWQQSTEAMKPRLEAAEKPHSKADIAAELARRDAKIERQMAELANALGDVKQMAEQGASKHRPPYDEQQRRIRNLESRLAAAERDAKIEAERLNVIVRLVEEHGGVRIHNGDFNGRGHVGLWLANCDRNLREALDEARGASDGG